MIKKIVLITGLSIVSGQAIYALDQLKNAKKEITQGKNQLVQTRTDLMGAYKDLDAMLVQVGGALPMITKYKDLVTQFKPVAETVRAVLIANLAIPPLSIIAGLALGIAGDVPDIMGTMGALLGSIHGTLSTIDNTMRPKSHYLLPDNIVKCTFTYKDAKGDHVEQKNMFQPQCASFADGNGVLRTAQVGELVVQGDPKGLYKQLDIAVQSFAAVENAVDQIMTRLQNIGTALRGGGKKAPPVLEIEELEEESEPEVQEEPVEQVNAEPAAEVAPAPAAEVQPERAQAVQEQPAA